MSRRSKKNDKSYSSDFNKNNKILIAKRRANQYLKNKWEFPGGKIEKGETPEECLRRELKEEFDIIVKISPFFMESIFQYPHKKIQLLAYFAYLQSGYLKANEHEEYKWVSINELDHYEFLEADQPIVSKINLSLPRDLGSKDKNTV